MTALTTLAACAVVPWLGSRAVRAWFGVGRSASVAQGERALERSQRVSLLGGIVVIPAAAVAGALFVDPMVGTRWPTAGSWLFATICATTAWSSLAIARRSADEADSMPTLEVIGRVVEMVTVPAVGVALSLLAVTFVDRTVPAFGPVHAVLAALLSFGALVVVSPWLAMQLGLWRLLPFRIQSGGVSWRVAHLPVPSPFLTHAAALPWLRTVLVTDGLFQRAPALRWRSLVRYEIGGSPQSQSERVARWLLALTLRRSAKARRGNRAGRRVHRGVELVRKPSARLHRDARSRRTLSARAGANASQPAFPAGSGFASNVPQAGRCRALRPTVRARP
jgi:hypothetical protein